MLNPFVWTQHQENAVHVLVIPGSGVVHHEYIMCIMSTWCHDASIMMTSCCMTRCSAWVVHPRRRGCTTHALHHHAQGEAGLLSYLTPRTTNTTTTMTTLGYPSSSYYHCTLDLEDLLVHYYYYSWLGIHPILLELHRHNRLTILVLLLPCIISACCGCPMISVGLVVYWLYGM